MRHYEIVFLINSSIEKKPENIINYYTNLIKENNGYIHRLEDWGDRQLAYHINKLYKARYYLMNIEIKHKIINQIEKHINLNEDIIRFIIIRMNKAITGLSQIKKIQEESKKIKNN